MVEFVPYESGWRDAFERLKSRLEPQLREIGARIEHVGSASVVGLGGKPILDVDVVVSANTDVPDAIHLLRELGYRHRGDLGIPGREAFTAPDDGEMRRHVYLVVADEQPHRDHVDFRDYLRRDLEAARRYAALKSRLEEQFSQDSAAYTEAKAPFVEEALKAARGV